MTIHKLAVAVLLLSALFLVGQLLEQYQHFSVVSSAYQAASKEHYTPELSRMYGASADAYTALFKTNCFVASILFLGAGIYIARLYKNRFLYMPAAFLLAAWLFTATFGICSVERNIFEGYTQNPFIKKFVETHYHSGWTNAKSDEVAKIPSYYFHSGSPAPFVVITDADFTQGVTAGLSFRRVYVWCGEWRLIMERVTGVS